MAIVSNATVLSIKEYNEDIREYIIKPDVYRRFEAGTFLQLTLEKVTASEVWPESRTFSIASCYDKASKVIKLIIRKSGHYTTKIFEELLVNKECTIKYSFGEMLLPQFDNENNIVCIAAGSGIAPFLSFVEELKESDQLDRLELFYTVRKNTDFISYDYLKEILSASKLHLFCTDENSDKAENRLMSIEDIANGENILNKHYYICGSPEFITFFKEKLMKLKIKNIYLDEWE